LKKPFSFGKLCLLNYLDVLLEPQFEVPLELFADVPLELFADVPDEVLPEQLFVVVVLVLVFFFLPNIVFTSRASNTLQF